LRVRIFGWHNGAKKIARKGDKEPGVKTSELPWAQVMQPPTNGSNSGVGQSGQVLMQGTWVMGMFLDGEIAREPLVMGSIPGIPMEYSKGNTDDPDRGDGFYDQRGPGPDKYSFPRKTQSWDIEEPDTNRLSRNDPDYPHKMIDRKKQNQIKSANAKGYTYDEPVLQQWTDFKAEYPNNKVWETERGHIFEVDDTNGFERIHVYHENGSYINWDNGDPDGEIKPRRIDKVTGNQFTFIEGNHYNTTIGDIHITGRHITHLCQTFMVAGTETTLKTSKVTVKGKLTAEGLASRTGASDSFVDMFGKVITVKDGIVVSITEGG